jgi:hypothetical protein
MLIIVGLSLLAAAIADATSSARVAHPPTENYACPATPLGVDRRDVPLSDHGRRGGAARNPQALVLMVDLSGLEFFGTEGRCGSR